MEQLNQEQKDFMVDTVSDKLETMEKTKQAFEKYYSCVSAFKEKLLNNTVSQKEIYSFFDEVKVLEHEYESTIDYG